MVDLVKIRKKSKEAKEPAAEPEPAGVQHPVSGAVAPRPVEPPSPAPEVERVPSDVLPEPEGAPPPSPIVEEPSAVARRPAASKGTSKSKAAAPGATTSVAPEPPAVVAVPAPVPTSGEGDADEVDEDRLARFKRLAGKRRRWVGTARGTDQSEVAAASTAPELELLRFRVAGEEYAVDIDKIVEIVPPRTTTRVPNAEESIVGIMSLRGTIVTVIDLRRKLGHPRADLSTLKDARMIVVERAGETAGFLVDRVSRVVKLDPAELESHPVVSLAEQSEYVSGVFQAQDSLVILLDIERILAG